MLQSECSAPQGVCACLTKALCDCHIMVQLSWEQVFRALLGGFPVKNVVNESKQTKFWKPLCPALPRYCLTNIYPARWTLLALKVQSQVSSWIAVHCGGFYCPLIAISGLPGPC